MTTGWPAAISSLGRREAPVLGQRDAWSLPFSLLFASSAWVEHAESFQARRIKHIERAAARALLIDVSRVFNADFVSGDQERCGLPVRADREFARPDLQVPVDVEGWLDEKNLSPATLSSGRRLRAPSATLSRAASGVGELPPSKREPITGHEAVYVRSAATDRHLGADRIGLPGDAHYWNEESNYAQTSVNRDFVAHGIAEERIRSAPSVSTESDEINARRQLAVAHYVRNGGV
jgi:hypothetical protein